MNPLQSERHLKLQKVQQITPLQLERPLRLERKLVLPTQPLKIQMQLSMHNWKRKFT